MKNYAQWSLQTPARIEEVGATRLAVKSPGEWYLSVNSDTTDELSSGNSARSAFPDDVQLLDTTLRDGEQAPGVSLTPDEKVEIAEALEAADIDVIEAGSACTSEGERDCIRRVTDLNLDATVTSFARGIKSDIDHALDCNVDGITLVVPSSDKHIETKVGSTREEVIESSVELVEYATDHDLWVELLGEDGSRADPEFLVDLADAGHDAGADRFCYADTVGHASPEHTFDVVSQLAELGPTSVHTHDDLGFGMTNVHAGLRAGADFVHGTVNGIGERAGNVAIEEVAIALSHSYDIETLNLPAVYELATTVSQNTGVPLAPNKAVIGENTFTHESGIHTDGTLKDGAMYEPYPPETVGRERRLVLGKHAGRAGVEAALKEHNIDVSDDELPAIVERVKTLGERDKRVTDADLLAIAEDVQGRERDRYVELLTLTTASGTDVPTASVKLRVGDEERTAAGTGSGPVDAAVKAVREALGPAADAELDSFHVDAITGGTDAVVTVEVEMTRGDHTVTVAASDSDITRASVDAMVDALDRLLAASPPEQPVADD